MTDFLSQEFLQGELSKLSQKNKGIDFSKYENDPDLFFHEVLKLRTWPKQSLIANSINENKRVSVRSCHKSGKSLISAAIALWWVLCKPKGKVVMISPTHRQIKDILWSELRHLYNQANKSSNLEHMNGQLNVSPQTGLKFPDGRYVVGFATDDAVKLQGYSGASLLFIVDESSGVSDETYKAIRANLAGGGKLLALGNPNFPLGWFYDSFNSKESQLWKTIHISAYEVIKYSNDIPGLATEDWCDQMYLEEGENSPEYQIRVLGEFPSMGEEQLFSVNLLESSINSWHDDESLNANLNCELKIGIDVSRTGEGDPTIIQFVRGNYAYKPVDIPGSDGKELAQSIENVIKNFLKDGEKFPALNVDSIGIGASPVDFLRELGIKVNDINVGMNANNSQYYNLRTEAYMNMMKWIDNGGMIPPDQKLKKDLLAHSYHIDDRGRIRLEKKDKVKLKLSGRSPDRSDALSLALINNNKRKNNNIRYISMGKTKTSNLKKSGL